MKNPCERTRHTTARATSSQKKLRKAERRVVDNPLVAHKVVDNPVAAVERVVAGNTMVEKVAVENTVVN
jgi:hypothetical protein